MCFKSFGHICFKKFWHWLISQKDRENTAYYLFRENISQQLVLFFDIRLRYKPAITVLAVVKKFPVIMIEQTKNISDIAQTNRSMTNK